MNDSLRADPYRHPEQSEGQVRMDRLSSSNSFAVIPSNAAGIVEEVVRRNLTVPTPSVRATPACPCARQASDIALQPTPAERSSSMARDYLISSWHGWMIGTLGLRTRWLLA